MVLKKITWYDTLRTDSDNKMNTGTSMETNIFHRLKQIFSYKDVIEQITNKLVIFRFQVFDYFLSGTREDLKRSCYLRWKMQFKYLSSVDQFSDNDLDVHLVPGQALKHLELCALDVEAEQRHGGAVQGEEDGEQGETLELV